MAAPICDETDSGTDFPGTALDASTIVDDINTATGIDSCGSGQIAMGLGALGDGGNIFKRKFRWTFEIEYCCASGGKQVASSYVKTGARPNIEIDEIEINYLNGVTWIPGKGKWQPIEIAYYDIANSGGIGQVTTTGLLGWIASVYNFTDPICLQMGGKLEDYEGIARLTLYDGCGNPVEAWLLEHCWPKAVNWGNLDMSSSEECLVTITLRYTNVSYVSFCPPGSIDRCPCTGCGTSSSGG